MSKRSLTTLLVVALVINVIFLWSQRRAKVRHIDTRSARNEKILEWESLPVVPLTEPAEELVNGLRGYPSKECPDVPAKLLVPFEALSADQNEDLFKTIADLLSCYSKSDGGELVKYMQTRKESLTPEFRQAAIESLIAAQQVDPAQVNELSDLEIIQNAWKNEKCHTGWKAIAHDAGHVCIWRCKGCDPKSMQTLGTSDNRIFHSQSVSTHLFEPKFTFDQAHKNPEGVLLADIKVLIEHDDKFKKERSPYFIRFWYSTDDLLWHPFHFVHVRVNETPQAQPVNIMF